MLASAKIRSLIEGQFGQEFTGNFARIRQIVEKFEFVSSEQIRPEQLIASALIIGKHFRETISAFLAESRLSLIKFHDKRYDPDRDCHARNKKKSRRKGERSNGRVNLQNS